MKEDIICALATPPGEGALSIIRVSGKGSFKLSRKLCPFLPQKIISHRIYFGTLLQPKTKKILDEALVFCFKKGRSFTGEESVEFSLHGGGFTSSLVLDTLIEIGARLAKRGEFSYRAFMNGKIDLLQAENILHLIQSRSPKAHSQALRGLKGQMSKHLKSLEKKLLLLLSHLEASIDFSDQNIEPFSIKEQNQLLTDIKKEVIDLLNGFEQGRINREGFSVILIGAPNAGKSSLFNHLIKEDKAIVTKTSGTTRDILSARFLLHQREIFLKDSAGLRKTPNLIEKKGIEKTSKELKNSDLVLFLIECGSPIKEQSFFYLDKLDKEKTIVAFSKADLLKPEDRKHFLKEILSVLKKKSLTIKPKTFFLQDYKKSKFKNLSENDFLWLSSFSKEGVKKELKKTLLECSEKEKGEIFISSIRQYKNIKEIKKYILEAKKLLNKQSFPELIAFELQSALFSLYQLLGKEYNEEVIKQIFEEFCLGK